MHFYGIESSKNFMKDLTIKKNINVVIWVQFNFQPSYYLKFVLKRFELVLFNGPFMILLVRCIIMPLMSGQNEYAWCLYYPNLIYFLMCSMSKYPE